MSIAAAMTLQMQQPMNSNTRGNALQTPNAGEYKHFHSFATQLPPTTNNEIYDQFEKILTMSKSILMQKQ